MSDGKYVFIRGLGERYSQTALNGSPLPSPEPEKEVVPLDLFPSGFLESLTTQKSYTPDQPADFSGGSVQIKTKDFPDRFTVKLGMSTSFNSSSQFNDGFIRYDGGGLDWLGFDDGARICPRPLPISWVTSGMGAACLPTTHNASPWGTPSGRKTSRSLRHPLGTHPSIGPSTAPSGAGWMSSRRGRLGSFSPGTYSDTYRLLENEIERKWRTSAFEEATADLATPNVDYSFTRGTRNINWGTIANFTLKPNPNQQVSFRATVTLNTDDEGRTYTGENGEDIGGTLRNERSRFVQRLMTGGSCPENIFFSSTPGWIGGPPWPGPIGMNPSSGKPSTSW